MHHLPELEALERRRLQLAARADAYRLALSIEARSIGAQTAGARRAIDTVRTLLPLFGTLSSLLALVPLARGKKLSGSPSRLARIVPWIARYKLATGVRSLVRSLRSHSTR